MFTQSTAEKRRIVERKHAETRDPKDARAARDVEPGACWAFTEHRTLAEIMAEGLL